MHTQLPTEYEKHIKRWRLDTLTSIVDEFDSALAEKIHHKFVVAHNYQNILLQLAGKSIVTFREVICVSANGYPDGALSLARNLYEQFITLSFFETHRQDINFEEYVEDFFSDYEIQRCKALEYEAKHCQNDLKEWEKLRAQHNSILGNAHHDGKGDYWWTGLGSFVDVVEDIRKDLDSEKMSKFLAFLHLLYKRACLSLHASCFGNTIRLGVDGDFVGVDTSRQKNGHEVALHLATSSFTLITGVVCKEFGIDNQTFTDRLNDLMLFYGKVFSSEYTEIDS